VNKTTANAAQFAKYIFLRAYSCTTAVPSCVSTNKNFIPYMTSWHNKILGYKLRTDEEQLKLKILKKLRTASLNSGFTDSYKKV